MHTSTPSISSTVSCAACLGRDAFALGTFAVGASLSLSLSISAPRSCARRCAGEKFSHSITPSYDATDVLRLTAVLYAHTRRPQTA